MQYRYTNLLNLLNFLNLFCFLFCQVQQIQKIDARNKTDNRQDNTCYALGINGLCEAKSYQDHKADDKYALEEWSVDHKLGFWGFE